MDIEALPIEASPRVLARIGGILYLIIIVVGAFGELYIRDRIVVPGDASATAANLGSMESLWRWGIAAELLLVICSVALALILYILTRPVSRDLALLAMFFNLVATTVEAAYSLQLVQALLPLGNASYLKAFSPDQLHALASLAVRSHVFGFGISLLLFGPFFLATGYLILRSGYFPKLLGVLYAISGLSYITNSFVLILAPQYSNRIFTIIAGPVIVGEASLCLWLLVKGVNMEKWNRWQAHRAPTGGIRVGRDDV